MRKIKFRGKRLDNAEWVFGSLHQVVNMPMTLREIEWTATSRVIVDKTYPNLTKSWILAENSPDTPGWSMVDTFSSYEVDPETIGQFTGLKDKNGTEIYEWDVLQSNGIRITVKWDNYECGWNIVDYGIHQFEIIGNTHDNLELLKTE